MTDIITEEQLELFAADLVPKLRIIDRALEIEDRKRRPAEVRPIGPWLCDGSPLDFLAHPGPYGLPVPISADHSRKHAKEYRAQISVCARCTTREECADMGASEKFGIWGGTLPHERED